MFLHIHTHSGHFAWPLFPEHKPHYYSRILLFQNGFQLFFLQAFKNILSSNMKSKGKTYTSYPLWINFPKNFC